MIGRMTATPAPSARRAARPAGEAEAEARVLAHGELEVHGRLPRASNATLLCTARLDGAECLVVYKPRRGERPLWDFPPGTLCRREVAAAVLAAAMGPALVPPTVMRDGPFGPGAVQLFVEEDPDVDVLGLIEEADPVLMPLAVFDVLANNADRKVSHCLVDRTGAVWGIDHGLTFSDEAGKLRTVLWGWADEPVPEELLEGVAVVVEGLGDATSGLRLGLESLLDAGETGAVAARARSLLRRGRFPAPHPYGPAVPWPPY